MSIFLKNKGSVTVFVTMILIPTFFFNGFLVDMARFKMYSNQAVMAADNYGAAVLSYYDEVAKDLYGLFSVSQTGLNKDAIKKSIELSLNPEGTDGFQPFASSSHTISSKFEEKSALSNETVLLSQISDYMKYRIIGVLADENSDALGVLDAVEQMESHEEDMKLAQEYQELADAAADAYEKMKTYYALLDELISYEIYIGAMNSVIRDYREFATWFYDSFFYDIYVEYFDPDLDPEGKDREKGQIIFDAEEIEKMHGWQIYDYNVGNILFHPDLKILIVRIFNVYLDKLSGARDVTDIVNFDNYEEKVWKLNDARNELNPALDKVEKEKEEVKARLDSGEASEAMRDSIGNKLSKLEAAELVTQDEVNDATDKMIGNTSKINSHAKDYEDAWQDIREDKVKVTEDETKDKLLLSSPAEIDLSGYVSPKDTAVYETLKKCLESDSDAEKEAEKNKKAAEEKTDDVFKELNEAEEKSNARDIPNINGQLLTAASSTYALDRKNIFEQFAKYFEEGELEASAVTLLDKFYLLEYDAGMFTNRVTNHDANDPEQTLSGYQFTEDINYAYLAEQEYLVAGKLESKENLKTVRNRIVMFRMVMNYANTYTIPELDSLISSLSEIVMMFNPVLGVALDQALRVAVAAIESYKDWEKLMKGEKVRVYKSEIGDLYAITDIAGLIGFDSSGYTESDGGVKLTYTQYIQIMMMFFTSWDDLSIRTGNLVMININNVKQGHPKTLSNFDAFKIKEAYTAVNVDFSGTLKFAVMPPGFARDVADGATYERLKRIEGHNYHYSMIRSY